MTSNESEKSQLSLAVVGSRSLDKSNPRIVQIVEMFLSAYAEKYCNEIRIRTGGAPGIDRLAFEYATKNNIVCTLIIPDWKKHGKAAGFIRNVEIWNDAQAGIAFWDGKSKGTAHSFEIAKKQNKPLIIVTINEKGEYNVRDN